MQVQVIAVELVELEVLVMVQAEELAVLEVLQSLAQE